MSAQVWPMAGPGARRIEGTWLVVDADDAHLHHLQAAGQVAHALEVEGLVSASEVGQDALETTCGLLCALLAAPGTLSRVVGARCPACCEATGYPSGWASPQADPSCAPRLTQRLDALAEPLGEVEPEPEAGGVGGGAGVGAGAAVGFVHAFTDDGWVAYAGGVIEVAQRQGPAGGPTTIVRAVIGAEVRAWLAHALAAEGAPPLAGLTAPEREGEPS